MIHRIDHVGIAVRDLDKAVATYRDAFGLKLLGIEAVESEGVRVAMFEVGESRIELLSPLVSGAGSVAKFLDARGEGVHHVCLGTDDIDVAVESLVSSGLPLVGAAPREGANGARVTFVHPRAACGVLVELAQRKAIE